MSDTPTPTNAKLFQILYAALKDYGALESACVAPQMPMKAITALHCLSVLQSRMAELEEKAEQPAIPANWKLVPIEPTEGMLNAADLSPLDIDYNSYMNFWRDMLSAAPEYEG